MGNQYTIDVNINTAIATLEDGGYGVVDIKLTREGRSPKYAALIMYRRVSSTYQRDPLGPSA
jgi:hypothetical protein